MNAACTGNRTDSFAEIIARCASERNLPQSVISLVIPANFARSSRHCSIKTRTLFNLRFGDWRASPQGRFQAAVFHLKPANTVGLSFAGKVGGVVLRLHLPGRNLWQFSIKFVQQRLLVRTGELAIEKFVDSFCVESLPTQFFFARINWEEKAMVGQRSSLIARSVL